MTDYAPPPISGDDISEHPLAVALRQVFWDLEKLIDEDPDKIKDNDTLRGRLMVIREKAKKGLLSTPTSVTPIVQAILPKLNAAVTLLLYGGDDNDGTAIDLLLELDRQLNPSPAERIQ
jgi:hypothetical protein